jgi:CDP-glucose 4,6-dehydratase
MAEFDDFYRGRRVLVTGDTGFKGSWLCLWLARLGAEVVGFALPPPTDRPSNFKVCRIGDRIEHVDGDVRDLEALCAVVASCRPDVVFHLAAQPLVPVSHEMPVETFSVNVMGTVHVLEAVRVSGSVMSVVMVTSDKCYRNKEWVWGYRETDELGGDDPYSASKACAELAVAAYRHGLEHVWSPRHVPAIASARAGNVIGGGDWSTARLVPDIVRAIDAGRPLVLRKPSATRPWQHVLEPLSGYLWLGRLLATGDLVYRSAWNFAPSAEAPVPVGELARRFIQRWGSTKTTVQVPESETDSREESTLLRLDSDKALHLIGWRTSWSLDQMIDATADWYRVHSREPEADLTQLSVAQIDRYVERARERGIAWANERG